MLETIILGPPLAPDVNFTIVSFTELHLDWEEPFTWPDHDIMQYRVYENLTGTNTITNHTMYSYNNEMLGSCQNITFKVSAYSDLGFSDNFTSSAHGLPIGK